MVPIANEALSLQRAAIGARGTGDASCFRDARRGPAGCALRLLGAPACCPRLPRAAASPRRAPAGRLKAATSAATRRACVSKRAPQASQRLRTCEPQARREAAEPQAAHHRSWGAINSQILTGAPAQPRPRKAHALT
jgi:hypothetical protein